MVCGRDNSQRATCVGNALVTLMPPGEINANKQRMERSTIPPAELRKKAQNRGSITVAFRTTGSMAKKNLAYRYFQDFEGFPFLHIHLRAENCKRLEQPR